jgi:hypothetical protein
MASYIAKRREERRARQKERGEIKDRKCPGV